MLGQKFLYMIRCHYEGGGQVRPLTRACVTKRPLVRRKKVPQWLQKIKVDFQNYFYTPGSGEHGPRFLTGGPGAAPGGVASKNGLVYMRVKGGFGLHRRESLSVCCYKTAVGVEKWLSRKVARLPRRVAESTPRPKGRWPGDARRHALPVCGSDNPRRLQLFTL